ncbi:MAG: type II secretion system protein [Kosmotogaceae bacterium]
MKNRKKGFSLVELLIVLAVIAALIATITPVAMNAIRKSQATKVAQNIKTLASSFENYLYVEGSDNVPTEGQIKTLGRDIDQDAYNLAYTETTNDGFTVYVWTNEDAHYDTLKSAVSDIIRDSDTDLNLPSGAVKLGTLPVASATYYYTFTFVVY